MLDNPRHDFRHIATGFPARIRLTYRVGNVSLNWAMASERLEPWMISSRRVRTIKSLAVLVRRWESVLSALPNFMPEASRSLNSLVKLSRSREPIRWRWPRRAKSARQPATVGGGTGSASFSQPSPASGPAAQCAGAPTGDRQLPACLPLFHPSAHEPCK